MCRYQHPWGVYDDSDAAAFQQLRDWTLAQVCMEFSDSLVLNLQHRQ
jgi:hypothetical protein